MEVEEHGTQLLNRVALSGKCSDCDSLGAKKPSPIFPFRTFDSDFQRKFKFLIKTIEKKLVTRTAVIRSVHKVYVYIKSQTIH